MPFEVWALVLDSRRIQPSILPPSYFLVDGDDWLAHILKREDFRKANDNDAAALDEIVRKLHNDLNAMGIQPIVFLEKLQSKNVKVSKNVTSMDAQRALLLQLRKTLKSLSVDIEECDSMRRAGTVLDFFRSMASRAEYSCYIYGSAAIDLWAVRDISYILFDTLFISECGDKVQAPVWNRSKVAAALSVTEKQLVELIILVGNRYTKPYGRKGYRSAQGGGVPLSFFEAENEDGRGKLLKTDDMVSLAVMRDWILQQGTNYTMKISPRFSPNVRGPFSSLQDSIEFSRVYYSNGDLTPFYDDMDALENSSREEESTRQPAAAAIMAAISTKQQQQTQQQQQQQFPSSRTVTITSGKRGSDASLQDIIMAESGDKSKYKKKEREREREPTKQPAVMKQEVVCRGVEVTRKGRRDGDDRQERRDRERERKNTTDSEATSVSSISCVTAVSGSGSATGIDENKGAQLRNLLGIKFGAPTPAPAPAQEVSHSDSSLPVTSTVPSTMIVAAQPAVKTVSTASTVIGVQMERETEREVAHTNTLTASSRSRDDTFASASQAPAATTTITADSSTLSLLSPSTVSDNTVLPSPAAGGGAAAASSMSVSAVTQKIGDLNIANSRSVVKSKSGESSPMTNTNTNTPVRRLVPGTSSSRLSSSSASPIPPLSNKTLPIDAYRSQIISHIETHPVTIIHGMTGCGKSSRLPQMILEHGESAGKHTMIMVSQPRRIAATALKNRLQESLGAKVGLRLGDGIREESSATRLWFVTTGYLVRLLAHNMESFKKFTHLVIDEVHERSADGDILCLLAKKMLEVHPHIRIILMSATVHTSLYEGYFNIPDETISVEGRRYSQTFFYCDDIFGVIPSSLHNQLRTLIDSTSSSRGGQGEVVADHIVKDQLILAAALTKQIASEGSSVLIFVSGMADINDLTEKFEKMKTKGFRLKVSAIHSGIPFEEQLMAFQPAGPGEAKVIIATNAAESSLTLPDCDFVVCLGTHKMLSYNDRHNASQLMNCWISKASANQRAGRTGRMRAGTVYRLYSKILHSKLSDHDLSEVHRLPLSEVILRLRVMLEDDNSRDRDRGNDVSEKEERDLEQNASIGTDATSPTSTLTTDVQTRSHSNSDSTGVDTMVTDITAVDTTSTSVSVPHTEKKKPSFLFRTVIPVLMALLEPPEMNRVERSLHYLFDTGMISSPDDEGLLTLTGQIAGRLPVDLMLGRFVSFGVAVGLSSEAVIMAAALSLPKSPFRIASTHVQSDPDEYNKLVKEGLYARSRLDRGHLSEPIMLLHALYEWRACESDKAKFSWCQSNCIAHARMSSFNSVAKNLHSCLKRIRHPGINHDDTPAAADGMIDKRRDNAALRSDSYPVLKSLSLPSSSSLSPPLSLSLSLRSANMLRLVSIWSFHNNLVSLQTPSIPESALRSALLPVSNINADMISSIFVSSADKERDRDRDRGRGYKTMRSMSDQSWSPSPSLSISPIPTGAISSQTSLSPPRCSWDDDVGAAAALADSAAEYLTVSATSASLSPSPTPSSSTFCAIPSDTRPAQWNNEAESAERRLGASQDGTLTPTLQTPSLTPSSSMGPEIQWRLEAEGRRTYTAEYADRTFESLLSSFTACVQEMHVPVAWMHSKHSVPEKTIIVMIDKLAPGILDFLKGVFPGSLEVLGSYGGRTVASNTNTSGSSSDKQISRLEELYNENISAVSWTLPPISARRSSSSSNIYLNNSSSSNLFGNSMYSSAPSTTDGLAGPAVLVCANCMPTDTQVRELFLGSEEISKKIPFSQLEAWKPLSKMTRSKMLIEFLPDAPSAYCSGGVDVVTVGMSGSGSAKGKSGTSSSSASPKRSHALTSSNSTSTSTARPMASLTEYNGSSSAPLSREEELSISESNLNFQSSSNSQSQSQSVSRSIARCEIIQDIPLGLRLINSIRLGGRGDRSTIALIGRGEGFDGTLREGKEISVRIISEDSCWLANRLGNVGITGSKVEELRDTSGKMRRVIMPNHSLQQVAQHTVTYALALVGDDAVRADGVTLLPLGKKWTALALECVGVSSMGLRLSQEEEPSNEQLAQVAFISKQLKNSSREGAAADIWRAADSLFLPWIDPGTYSSTTDPSMSSSHSSSMGRTLNATDIRDADSTADEGADVSVPLGASVDEKGTDDSPLGIVLSAANWLFQGREQDPDAPPVKAKRLKPPSTAPAEPANGGWWTATKK